MQRTPLPSQDYLQKRFRYEPNTGLLYWRRCELEEFATKLAWATWNTKFADKEVGYADTQGYLNTNLKSKRLKVHRIIWKMIHNEEPDCVDHIDHDVQNNKLLNLRAATKDQNNYNARKRRNAKTSTKKGVSWSAHMKKWRAQIRFNGENKHIGYYDTLEDAVDAYKSESIKYFGEFACQG